MCQDTIGPRVLSSGGHEPVRLLKRNSRSLLADTTEDRRDPARPPTSPPTAPLLRFPLFLAPHLSVDRPAGTSCHCISSCLGEGSPSQMLANFPPPRLELMRHDYKHKQEANYARGCSIATYRTLWLFSIGMRRSPASSNHDSRLPICAQWFDCGSKGELNRGLHSKA